MNNEGEPTDLTFLTGSNLCAFYRKYEIHFSLEGYILKSYNLKGIFSIILKFVEMIATKQCQEIC